jgi:8-oxo-dGTP pyrophosphatase MutT (NUDIX family)
MPNTDNSWQNDPKIRAWKESVAAAGCTIQAIKPLATIYRKNGELLFAFLDSSIITPEGRNLLPYCFIRGHATIVVPLLRNRDTGEERFLMVEQRRIGHGRYSLEFPAGMLDQEIENPRGVALRELHEETGLAIDSTELFELIGRPLTSSVGASDEAIYYYGCVIDLPGEAFNAFEGRLMSHASENEHIRVTLKTEAEAEAGVSSIQALLALYLFKATPSKR